MADALSGLSVPEFAAARAIADLGSGAGLPGLVLAAALPEARVWLVESVRRKADWIERHGGGHGPAQRGGGVGAGRGVARRPRRDATP